MQQNVLEIESEFSKLEKNLKENKSKYMDHIYDLILQNTKDNKFTKKRLNLFKFKDTNLLIVVGHHQYKPMCENLLDYYISQESYEQCSILKKIINNIG